MKRPRQKPRWTEAQRRAITTTDKSLLVSAAAGSGKTAVLAERCVHLVCDADPPCRVDQLLVVTFTRAAAAEMRARIESALRQRLAERYDPRLDRQLALIDRAEIGTLHSVCGKIVRRHFARLGIDPECVQLNEHDALLLRIETARRFFEACYAADKAGDFQRFLDQYARGQDGNLRGIMLRVYDLMMSTVDPQAWASAAVKRLHEAAEKSIEQSELGQMLLCQIRSRLESLVRQGKALQERMKQMHPPYVNYIAELGNVAADWSHTLKSGGYDALRRELERYADREPELPRGNKNDGYDPQSREAAQKVIKSFREEFKPEGTIRSLLRFSQEDWRAGIELTIPAARTLIQLVEQFEQQYTAAKRALRAVDFTDLERLALQVLRDPNRPGLHPSPAALIYQEQFAHVLVDEYQDINALQDAILYLLSRESAPDGSATPNLFCVGDVKQSIYRFRLADPQRFIERERRLRPAKSPLGSVIDLSHNFRSTPAVIDTINAVFKQLMSASAAEIEYDSTHELRPGHPPAEYPTTREHAVELHLLPPPPEPPPGTIQHQFNGIEREAAVAARLILDLVKNPGMGVKFGDFAVLLRAMEFKSQQFAAVLRRFEIPVHTDAAGGFFEATEIQDLLALLRVLDNPLQDIPLAALLRSPICRLPDPEDALARIRLAYRQQPAVPFHRAVFLYSIEKTGELAQRLSHFRKTLSRWRDAAHSQPLHEVLPAILDETGFIAFCSALPDGAQRVANVTELLDLARQFGSFRKQGVRRFLDFLQTLEAEDDLGRPPLVTNPGDVVRVMSIHRSKGLEFPIVIVPDLAKQFNLQDVKQHLLVDREVGIAADVVDLTRRVSYRSLASVVAKDRIRWKSLAEELRVLYVAMTRAREKLILIGSPKSGPDAADAWRKEWGKHAGALPADVVQSACSPLDWLGPAYASIAAKQSHLIRLVPHEESAVESLLDVARRRIEQPAIDPRVAALQPLEPREVADPAGQAVAELTWQYPMHAYTALPAALAVTALTKSGRSTEAGHSPSLRRIVKFVRPLPQPRFASDQRQLKPLEIGAATHRVLQLIDLATPPEPPAVDAALARLVERRFISPEQAKLVDRQAIVWFLGTPLGRLLREQRERVQREQPVFAPAERDPALPHSTDPRDRVMLRGVIDALVRVNGSLIVIDYKTDRVTSQTLPQRIEFYRPQLAEYARIISQIAIMPVKSQHLVFTHVRQVIDL